MVAHRGSSHSLAEHTLAAYQRAIEEGADAVECDVRLTRDGHLVCVHDRRIDRTSNGRGAVSEFDLAELARFDFASWKRDAVAPVDRPVEERATEDQPVPVLTLERLLRTVLAAPRPVRLLIETKHPTRYGTMVERTLVELLRRFGLADPPDRATSTVTVMSFSALALRRIRLLAPALPTVLLFHRPPRWRRLGALPASALIAGPAVQLVRAAPDYLRRLHRRGHQIYVWTVNHATDLDLIVSLPVAGVITDRPTEVLDRLLLRSTGGRRARA